MKNKWLTVSGVVFALSACGSSGSDGSGPGKGPNGDPLKPPPELSANPEPKPTSVGDPIGDPVSRVVGQAGGSVSLGNGGPTVEIPAGALDTDTTISVRWISSRAPHARGRTFRLEPEGVRFEKPVQVSFELPQEAQGTGSEQGLGVAYQDDEGYWRAVADVIVDVAAKKVVARVDHFSDWTVFQQLEIRPTSPSVRTKRVLGLWVYKCVEPASVDVGGFDLRLLPECNAASGFGDWAVNGVQGGDEVSGSVMAMLYGAAFTAPARKPAANPVAVTVKVPLSDARKALLVSNVRVTDDHPCSLEKPCTWSGRTRAEHPGADEWTTADVRWVIDEVDEDRRVVRYRAVGSLIHHLEQDQCSTPIPMRLEEQTEREIALEITYPEDGAPEVYLTDSVAGWETGLVCVPVGEESVSAHFSADVLKLTEDGDALVGGFRDESYVVDSRFNRE